MPLFQCSPEVLISTLGSVEGVRHQMVRRRASTIVSVEGNDIAHTIVADHPSSRVSVETVTTPKPPSTSIVIVSRPHTPLVAGGFVRVEHIITPSGPHSMLVSNYEVGWTKKPPVLPLQRKIEVALSPKCTVGTPLTPPPQSKFDQSVQEELKDTYKFLKKMFP